MNLLNRPVPANAHAESLKRIQEAKERIEKFLQNSEATAPEDITWGHLCDLGRLARDLEEIAEYAR